MTVRLLIADDQHLVRTGLQVILNTEPDIEVIGQATTGLEAVTMAHELLPDVVLMDIRMPELDGIEATRQITTRSTPAPASWSSRPSTSINTYSKPSAPAPAASSSKTSPPTNSSLASG